MNKKLIVYIVLVCLTMGAILVIDAYRPKPIDWTPTYGANDKIPLGLHVFNREAAQLFKGDSLQKFSSTPYQFFDAKYNYDESRYTVSGSFIAISENNTIDPESVKELLTFADYGNTVLLSMKNFPQKVLDTLKLKDVSKKFYIDSLQFSIKSSPASKYWFKEGASSAYFDSLPKNDSLRILGYVHVGKDVLPNFIEAKFGLGRILLHTQPAAFSNFYLLKGNHYKYAQQLASHLPVGKVYWQNEKISDGVSQSPIRYINSQPALKYAWRLGLLGLVIFIFFNARRKQRIIPQIDPVRNTTVDFAKTIGNLYYMEGNHHTIIEKKIIYFLEKVRTDYLIDTSVLDDDFIQKLHLKTGKPVDDIQKTVRLIKKQRHNFESTKADVATINNAIEKLRL